MGHSKADREELKSKLLIVIQSAGLKVVGGLGNLPKADLYLDARAIADGTQGTVGINPLEQVIAHDGLSGLLGFRAVVDVALMNLSHRRRGEDMFSRPFIIQTFCAYGMHRSVALKQYLSHSLGRDGWKVEVR